MEQCYEYNCPNRSSLTGFCRLTACDRPKIHTEVITRESIITPQDTLKELAEFMEKNQGVTYLKEEFDTPIKDLYSVSTILCLALGLGGGCKNCPVTLFDYDKRTKFEKCSLHVPCQNNLYKWILDQASKEKEE